MAQFIVWTLGIVVALQFWTRARQIAGLVVIGCVLAIGVAVLGIFYTTAVPFLYQRSVSAATIGAISMVFGIFRTLAGAIIWGLLLLAVYQAVSELVRLRDQQRQ